MKSDVRHEWKYRIRRGELEILRNRLSAALGLDEYSLGEEGYTIHSLYFDDLFNTCAKDNDGGNARRKKYRIRYYNGYDGKLKLECKEKCNELCYKETAEITPDMYEDILREREQELFWKSEDPLVRQFCTDIMAKGFRPKAIVNYQRIAFVEPVTDVRITFDLNICCSDGVERFLDGEYPKIPIQRRDEHVLEVKFGSILPGYLKNMITMRSMNRSAFSKYYYARNVMDSMGRIMQ